MTCDMRSINHVLSVLMSTCLPDCYCRRVYRRQKAERCQRGEIYRYHAFMLVFDICATSCDQAGRKLLTLTVSCRVFLQCV